MSDYQTSQPCQCAECRSYCLRPCWPTPDEAMALIDAGYAHRLMLDWWQDDNAPIAILCGALKGHEGQITPYWPKSAGGCTFYVNGLCQLHNLGLKPLEGRVAHHTDGYERQQELHRSIPLLWDCEAGNQVIQHWRTITGIQGNPWD